MIAFAIRPTSSGERIRLETVDAGRLLDLAILASNTRVLG